MLQTSGEPQSQQANHGGSPSPLTPCLVRPYTRHCFILYTNLIEIAFGQGISASSASYRQAPEAEQWLHLTLPLRLEIAVRMQKCTLCSCEERQDKMCVLGSFRHWLRQNKEQHHQVHR